jgi:Tfp pilus assembly protein PilV
VPSGYTLVETVVAVFVFSVGGLALASTSAVIAKELNSDAERENAAREQANRIELVISHCPAGRLRC